MIQIKNESVLREIALHEMHPVLMDLLAWFLDIAIDVFITGGHRPGDSGVHGQLPCRGIDLRDRIYTAGHAEVLVAAVNEHWQYDPSRPHLKCGLIHGEGMNSHIHLQVHPNTRKI